MASSKDKPARRGATTQRKTKKSTGGGFKLPGWLWGVAGLAAGFFLAQHQHGTAPWQEPDDTPQATVLSKPSGGEERSAARQTESAPEQPSMPTFEFYTLLPDTEVIAPGVSLPSTVNRPEVAAQEVQSTASSETPSDESVASTDESNDPIAQVIAANMRPEEQVSTAQQAPASSTPNRYMLQAASFRELSDAEQLRVRLRNLSLLAQVSEVKANGDTWHRVQVGPYEDTRELNRAQDLMATQGIEPLLIQLQN
jgi:cell division protein FtsN